MKNQVQLITYPDALGGSLPALEQALERYFAGLFGGIHILPPFPSTGDRGFAPKTYFEIAPAFGSWEDIRRLGQRYDLMLDLMVNHISRHSDYFQDFQRRGRSSPYADLFITLDKVWPNGQPLAEDVAQIFLRRPEHPFADVSVAESGATERVWATFGTRDWSEQIDLDVHSPAARRLFTQIFEHFARSGVRFVRLDAVAFVIKKPGTSCFFVEPEIFDFLAWIESAAAAAGIGLLLEVHAHHSIQDRLAGRGYWVYNFGLPALVLHTLLNRSSTALRRHLAACPRQQITMLDCHDGIPVQPDIEDLLEIEDARRMVDACLQRGANLSRIFSARHRRQADFDAHQVNMTYYSALGAQDDAYLSARAIQFFAPGIPQVYYNGLLAGENTPGEVEQVGDRRAINRHNYSAAEIAQAVQKPVVQRLLRLIRLRSTHPAFQGEFALAETDDRHLDMSWRSGGQAARLQVDLATSRCRIELSEPGGKAEVFEP